MKLNSKITNIILLTIMLSLSGCAWLAPKAKFDPNDLTASVVFGYIDTKDMPSEFAWAKIQGLGGDDDYVTASTIKGAFWHSVVKPGYRQVRSFGGFTSRNMFGQGDKANIYRFDAKDKNSIAINIKKPGVHFMGSYKFVMRNDKFEIRRIKSPSEKAVLKMVLKEKQQDGSKKYYTRQIKMIKKRLAQLR